MPTLENSDFARDILEKSRCRGCSTFGFVLERSKRASKWSNTVPKYAPEDPKTAQSYPEGALHHLNHHPKHDRDHDHHHHHHRRRRRRHHHHHPHHDQVIVIIMAIISVSAIVSSSSALLPSLIATRHAIHGACNTQNRTHKTPLARK